jgi:hypothetical protein
MRKLFLLLVVLTLTSCEHYVTEFKDVTLSGTYVVSKLHVTNVDQNQSRDSLYLVGGTYINPNLPHPFNRIIINNFYINFDYSTIRINKIGVLPNTGQDIWQYGSSPLHPTIQQNREHIIYYIGNRTPYYSGNIDFIYTPINSSNRRIVLGIEDDGLESLQLKTKGNWVSGPYGQNQMITFTLTRVGP